MIEWILKEVEIKSLKKHPKNPREIKKDKFNRLSKLIEKFGLIDKPIINEDMTIIGGHQRIEVLKKKKSKVVECWVSKERLSDEDIDELCIGLNLHQGTWDYDCLANSWDPLDLLNYGFSEEQLLGTCKEAEEVLDDNSEEVKKNKKTKECPNCGCEF